MVGSNGRVLAPSRTDTPVRLIYLPSMQTHSFPSRRQIAPKARPAKLSGWAGGIYPHPGRPPNLTSAQRLRRARARRISRLFPARHASQCPTYPESNVWLAYAAHGANDSICKGCRANISCIFVLGVVQPASMRDERGALKSPGGGTRLWRCVMRTEGIRDAAIGYGTKRWCEELGKEGRL